MSQPFLSRNREESYTPNYGYGQGTNLTPKIHPVVENTQAQKKPFLINYYPSGNTNNPQRVIAQVETVTREVVKNPVIEPMRENRSHHGDNQLKRDDEFINKIRDETMKANGGVIDQPKVLSTTNLVDQVNRDDALSRNQPRTTYDDLADPNHPRKMAELVSRVSNWRGVNGGSKPIVDGYNIPADGCGYNKVYDQSPTVGYEGYGNSRDKVLDESYNVSRNNKIPNVTQSYDHISYGGDPNRNMINGNRGRVVDDGYMRRNDIINPQTPRGTTYGYDESRVLGYDGGRNNNHGMLERTTGEYDKVYGNGYNSSLPRSTYDGRQGVTSEYDKVYGNGYSSGLPRSTYDGRQGTTGEYDKVYGNGYSSGLPRSTYDGRQGATGATSSTVISSVEAVSKYKGALVPYVKT